VKAPQAANDAPESIEHLLVCATDDGWSLMVDDLDKPAWTVSTKAKAVAAARELAEELSVKLDVQTRAGRVHKSYDYREGC